MVEKIEVLPGELKPDKRVLMGPGPSQVNPRVYKAIATPLVGYLDPYFFNVMEEVSRMLRVVFRTGNRITFAVSGTGTAGMQAAFFNFVEAGDTVIIGLNGFFSGRMVEMAERIGARVVTVEAPWGKMIEPERLIAAMKKHPGARLVALVHAETSTGARQPLEEVGAACAETDTLFLVDAVTSLAGVELDVDGWKIDVCYSGTQKCLSVPPGLAPITVSEKALRVLEARRTPVPSWYLDIGLIMTYWGKERVYHHTGPISMIYALYEGLRIVLEEGLDKRIARHEALARLLKEKLLAIGFSLFAQEGYRLSTLSSVVPPAKIDILEGRKRLLSDYGIEIGGGLGPLKEKVWRIGLMGESASRENVEYLVAAISEMMER